MNSKPKVMFVLMLVVILGFILGNAYAQSTQSNKITREGFFACMDMDSFKKLWNYQSQKDMEAFKKGLDLGLSRGTCTIFHLGEEVFVMENEYPGLGNYVIKIRRKSDIAEYWTFREIIQTPKK